MLNILETILSPIIWVMDFFLVQYASLTGSVGLAIILLALTFTLLLLPLQKYGRRIEDRVREKMRIVSEELAPYKGKLRGEALFIETERIYKANKYHPIESVGLGMSFIILLPVLISAIILLGSHPLLEGQSFLFLEDLSEPDRLLGPINVLPFIMTAITVFDALKRYSDDRAVLARFLILAAVLFFLVYNLASALVLYWTTNVTLSLLLTLGHSGSTSFRDQDS